MAPNNAIEIRKALLDLGITQAQIARDLGIHIVSVNQVIHGRHKSRRVTEYIEQLCNRPRDS